MDSIAAARMCKALADANRLEIVRLLSEEPQNATELLKHFDFTQPTLSHHMRILQDAEIVLCTRLGTQNLYSLRRGKLNAWTLYWLQLALQTE